MILLHGNGYKALAALRSDDLRLAVVELDGKVARLGKPDLKPADDLKLKPGDRRKT
jgi:hypothetical protein